jgi:exonuclease III
MSKETKMIIVSWNCHFYLDEKKYLEIMKYDPQVLIIQECTKNDFDHIKNRWKYKNWYNDDLNNEESLLGIAIFSSDDFKIGYTDIFNRNYRYVIPYAISNSKNEHIFMLFSVWIKPVEGNYDWSEKYEKNLADAVDYYRNKKMLDHHAIYIGDFNTFAKDDNGLKLLEEKMLPLVNCAKEAPLTPTYYHAINKMGVNDFCFVSEDIISKFEIRINIPEGWDEKQDKAHHWKGLSDHCPIIVDLQEKTKLA